MPEFSGKVHLHPCGAWDEREGYCDEEVQCLDDDCPCDAPGASVDVRCPAHRGGRLYRPRVS